MMVVLQPGDIIKDDSEFPPQWAASEGKRGCIVFLQDADDRRIHHIQRTGQFGLSETTGYPAFTAHKRTQLAAASKDKRRGLVGVVAIPMYMETTDFIVSPGSTRAYPAATWDKASSKPWHDDLVSSSEIRYARKFPLYMPYPPLDAAPIPVTEQINQIPDLRIWKPFVATTAHELDRALQGSHEIAEVPASTKEALRRLGTSLIGWAWSTVVIWERLNPTDLDANPPAGTVAQILWKKNKPSVKLAVSSICPQCTGNGMDASPDDNHWMWARRFCAHADPAAFLAKLNSGIVPKTVITKTQYSEVWSVGSNAVSFTIDSARDRAQEIQAYENLLKSYYLAAIKHYDDVIAHSQQPHGH